MVERGSAHHAPRVDDELAHESAPLLHGAAVPGREREDREPEAPTAGEPGATPEIGSPEAGDDVPVHAEVIARSELARWLLPSAFPATAAGLVEIARAQGAPDATIEQLGQLSPTMRFDTFGELWNTLDGPIEHAPDTREPAPAPQPERDAARAANVLEPALPPEVDASTSAIDVLVGIVATPARVALGAVRTVGHLVGRGVGLLNPVHRSTN